MTKVSQRRIDDRRALTVGESTTPIVNKRVVSMTPLQKVSYRAY
jgi:hypothetical protein